MDVNEHERLFNFTQRHKVRYRNNMVVLQFSTLLLSTNTTGHLCYLDVTWCTELYFPVAGVINKKAK